MPFKINISHKGKKLKIETEIGMWDHPNQRILTYVNDLDATLFGAIFDFTLWPGEGPVEVTLRGERVRKSTPQRGEKK